MKNSFALLITIVFMALFSLLAYEFATTNTLKSNQNTHMYLKTQASLHLDFFEDLIQQANLEHRPSKLTLEHEQFIIEAYLTYSSLHTIVDAFVQYKSNQFFIRVHRRFLKKL